MKLKQVKKVVFEPMTHTYLMGETLLKGVTTLMKEQGLSPDYSGIPEETLRKAAERGTAIHQLLEDYDNNVPVVLTDEVKEYPKLGLKIVQSEYLVTDGKSIASMIDKVIFVDEETVDLADVKTTSTLHKESVSWQLSIYKYLFEKQNKGIHVRNLYGIHVRNRKVKLVKVEEIPMEEVKEVIQCNARGEKYFSIPDIKEMPSASLILTEEEENQLTTCTSTIAQLERTIKELKEVQEELNEKLITYMQGNGYTELSTTGGVIKLKDSYTKQTIDSKGLRAKYPEIAEEFTRTSTVRASITFKNND